MSQNRRQARRPRKMPLRIAVSLIVVLSVGVLALSYVALTGIGSGPHPGLPVKSGVTTSEEIVPFRPVSPDTQPEPAAGPAEMSASQRMLAIDGSTAMRATSGTCENPGTVEVSSDRAQSWNSTSSLAGMGATQILRLLPTDSSRAQVVALDSNCEPQVYRSADLGATWEGPLPVIGTWYFAPNNPTQVGAPSGAQALPCEGAELAAAGDQAAVRCLDGSVVTTVDNGITWSDSPGVTDALAINYSPESYVVAEVGYPTCEGLRLTSFGGSPSTGLDGCFETALAAWANDPENIAIAQSGVSILLWVGDNLVISTDGGRTWL